MTGLFHILSKRKQSCLHKTDGMTAFLNVSY